MYGEGWNSTIALEAVQADLPALRRYVVERTAARLVEVALFVSDDAGLDDFSDIMNFDEDGPSPLETVVDELAGIVESYPSIVEAFRDSEDWDQDSHVEDASRAAAAAVAESLEAAAGLWNDRPAPAAM